MIHPSCCYLDWPQNLNFSWPLSSDVGFKETHLLVDPGLSLGHLPRGLARLELRQLAITRSLGLEPTSHIKGLELEFCRYFCPESLSSGPVVETWMFLVIQFWVLLYKLHNGNFVTVSNS